MTQQAEPIFTCGGGLPGDHNGTKQTERDALGNLAEAAISAARAFQAEQDHATSIALSHAKNALRDAIEAQAQRIVELEAENADILSTANFFDSRATQLAKEKETLRAELDAIKSQEPIAWFTFADSNGPVPLELYGFDEDACKYAMLMNARSVGWKGTAEGYLLQQGWTIRPVYAAPVAPAKPAQDVDAHLVELMRYMRSVASFERNAEIDTALANTKAAQQKGQS